MILPSCPAAAGAALLARDPVMQALGLRLLESEAGHAAVELQVQPAHLNATGVVHGGVLFTLADSAFAIAANNEGEARWAAHAAIEFLRPAHAGARLRASACRVAPGLYDIAVEDEAGQTIALMRGRASRAR